MEQNNAQSAGKRGRTTSTNSSDPGDAPVPKKPRTSADQSPLQDISNTLGLANGARKLVSPENAGSVAVVVQEKPKTTPTFDENSLSSCSSSSSSSSSQDCVSLVNNQLSSQEVLGDEPMSMSSPRPFESSQESMSSIESSPSSQRPSQQILDFSSSQPTPVDSRPTLEPLEVPASLIVPSDPLSDVPMSCDPAPVVPLAPRPRSHLTFRPSELIRDYEHLPLIMHLMPDIYRNLFDRERRMVMALRAEMAAAAEMVRRVTPRMKTILFDWLIDLTGEWGLGSEVLFLAKNYFYRYLTRQEISRDRVQLIGIACLLLAVKFDQGHGQNLEDAAVICQNAYTVDEIREVDMGVVHTLGFEMIVSHEMSFFDIFFQAYFRNQVNQTPDFMKRKVQHLGRFIMEVSLLHHDFATQNPSNIALASLCLSLYFHNFVFMSESLAARARILIPMQETDEWVMVMQNLFTVLCRPRVPETDAVERKYERPEFDSCSLIPFREFQRPSLQAFQMHLANLSAQHRRLHPDAL
eukprot:TRINITY_DN693_c3_g1_i1.p1 TRINITY_DN693_c3_g1~~TRINITY_DN693_c3_g1_i1.p1  ORF type:complete len:523 (-),score=154.21 TRINITY_DN693_c3_g1_i1:21-1589(-)